jgi:hypothetical protein
VLEAVPAVARGARHVAAGMAPGAFVSGRLRAAVAVLLAAVAWPALAVLDWGAFRVALVVAACWAACGLAATAAWAVVAARRRREAGAPVYPDREDGGR